MVSVGKNIPPLGGDDDASSLREGQVEVSELLLRNGGQTRTTRGTDVCRQDGRSATTALGMMATEMTLARRRREGRRAAAYRTSQMFGRVGRWSSPGPSSSAPRKEGEARRRPGVVTLGQRKGAPSTSTASGALCLLPHDCAEGADFRQAIEPQAQNSRCARAASWSAIAAANAKVGDESLCLFRSNVEVLAKTFSCARLLLPLFSFFSLPDTHWKASHAHSRMQRLGNRG